MKGFAERPYDPNISQWYGLLNTHKFDCIILCLRSSIIKSMFKSTPSIGRLWNMLVRTELGPIFKRYLHMAPGDQELKYNLDTPVI